MQKKLLFIIIFIIASVGSIYLLKSEKKTSVQSPIQITNNDTQLSELPDDWQTYTSPEFGFAINHPADVRTELTQNGVHFLKLGETQATGTELFDGLSLLIFTAPLNNKNFDDFVQQDYKKVKDEPTTESISQLQETKVSTYTGYSFTYTALGTSTVYYLKSGTDRYIKISDMTVEPQNETRDFRKTVSQMLNTFQITTNQGDTVTSADNAPSGSLHNLPVPKAVSAVKSFASQDLGVPEGKVIVLSAYEKEWSDSCLGLAQKGEMCAQVITPGFEITIEAGEKQRIYRTNNDGTIIKITQ